MDQAGPGGDQDGNRGTGAMIYQTDKEFTPAIFHWGCYLLSLCERLNAYFQLPFTHEEVLDLLETCQLGGAIDSEITLVNPQAVCDFAVGRNKVMFAGKFEASYITNDKEFEIVCYHKDGASFNHFCSGNGKGIVLYDPWGPGGSDSVRYGNIIGKRIYKIL